MIKLLLVGIGGFVGAVLRFGVSGVVQNWTRSVDFPYGTLVVNVIGCFLLGTLSQLVESQSGMSSELRLLLMVGLLGSFTTYSTFNQETLNLMQSSQYLLAITNIFIQLLLGLSAAILGRFALTSIWR